MHKWLAMFVTASTFLSGGCDLPARHFGDETETKKIYVIGSASNSNSFEILERPFWEDLLPKASNGRISTKLLSISESGLKGPQIARLLSAGALDVAYGDFASITGDVREFEGLDLPGVITDLETLHRAADAYKPVIDRIFNQHGIKLLGLFPYPTYAFFCVGTVASIDDLRGKKVRINGQAMADFISAIDAVPVSIPFADVIPALQTRVADCAVTSTYSGNRAGWHEVTESLYTLPIGSGIAFYGYSARGWRELSPVLQQLLQTEFDKLEDAAWELTQKQTQIGVNCNTGQGECLDGTRANMRLYEPSEADIARAHEIAMRVVVRNWSRRCSDRCVADWNATVGRIAAIRAERGS